MSSQVFRSSLSDSQDETGQGPSHRVCPDCPPVGASRGIPALPYVIAVRRFVPGQPEAQYPVRSRARSRTAGDIRLECLDVATRPRVCGDDRMDGVVGCRPAFEVDEVLAWRRLERPAGARSRAPARSLVAGLVPPRGQQEALFRTLDRSSRPSDVHPAFGPFARWAFPDIAVAATVVASRDVAARAPPPHHLPADGRISTRPGPHAADGSHCHAKYRRSCFRPAASGVRRRPLIDLARAQGDGVPGSASSPRVPSQSPPVVASDHAMPARSLAPGLGTHWKRRLRSHREPAG